MCPNCFQAVNLVNSSTPYSYDLHTQTYLQPVFAQQTLERFRSVNEHHLGSLIAEEKIDLDDGVSLPQGTPLLKLIDVGLKDRSSAPTVLAALLEALGKQTRYVHGSGCFAIEGYDRIAEHPYYLPLMTSKHFSQKRHIRVHISRQSVHGTCPCLASFSNMRAVVKHL